MPAKQKAKTSAADLAIKYLRAHQAGKRSYERADRLLTQLSQETKIGEEFPLNEAGRKAILVDRFHTDKSIIWTPCGARRWELKVIEP